MHVTIDFETYSEAGYTFNKQTGKWEALLNASKKGLAGVGTACYAKHPSTEILSLAYKLPDKEVQLWTPQARYLPHEIFDFLSYCNPSTPYVEAWNVAFERWIWEEVAVKRYGFPSMPVDRWRCAAAKSRAFALPGALGDAGRVLGTIAQKNKSGGRLLHKFSMPRNATVRDNRLRITPQEDPHDARLLYEYNKDDVKAEIEISERIPDLSPFELKFWRCDQEINHRGVQIDILSVLNCINIIEQAHEKYNAELPKLTYVPIPQEAIDRAVFEFSKLSNTPIDRITDKMKNSILASLDMTVTSSTQIARIRAWMAFLGVETESLDEEHIEQLLARPLLLPQVRRVLEIRQLIGSAAVKKLYAMMNQVTNEGRIHDLFVYHSARTGRAAGMGVQPQNLPRGEEGFNVELALQCIAIGNLEVVEAQYGNATQAVSNCLRGMFIAKPGHVLIASDYSAIEAVVLAELAGESWQQEVFRTHGMIYERAGSMITGISFDEILAHKERTGKHHEARRLGKVASLASGYGGWIKAWHNFGANEFLNDEEIKRAILAWRAASPAIVEFWGGQSRNPYADNPITGYYGVEGAAIRAVLYPGEMTAYNGISFTVIKDVLYCTLPSHRSLVYHKPRLELSTRRPGTYELSFEGWNTNPKNGAPGWIRQSTYGGKLVENLTQAVARDILATAIVNLEAAGFPIVLHVHDEIVAEIPQGSRSLEEFEAIMSTMPAWADGWPVVARGGWIGTRYCK